MRRSLLAAVAALLALPAAPAVAKAKPPTVGRLLHVIGQSGTAIDVTVPKGASLVVPKPVLGIAPGFASLSGGKSWHAVALISRSTRVAGKPVNAVQVHLPAPDHCPSTVAPPPAPVPKCAKLVEHTSFHGLTATASAVATSYALPAGTYQVVIAGPPNELVAAALLFTGVKTGRPLVLFAGRRVDATLARVRAADVAAAHASGTFPAKLAGPALAVLGAWHTTAGNEGGPFSYVQCVAAAAPAPEPCAAVGATGQSPPAGPVPKPAFSAVGTPPVATTNSGQATWQTPLLPAGSYVNTVRVARAGRGPAAGAFVLWLRTDATK